MRIHKNNIFIYKINNILNFKIPIFITLWVIWFCHQIQKFFNLKVAELFHINCGIYKDGSLSEKELCDYEEWREEEVKHRGLKLLDFMSERWEIDFKDEEEKLKLLRFDLD